MTCSAFPLLVESQAASVVGGVTRDKIVLEHLAYCKGRGMTPAAICNSVGFSIQDANWNMAWCAIATRYDQWQDGGSRVNR